MGNTGSFYLGHLSLSNIYLSFKMNNQHFVIGIIYLKRILFIVPRPVVVRYTSGVHFEDLDTREIIFRDGKYFSCIRNIFDGRDFFSVSSFLYFYFLFTSLFFSFFSFLLLICFFFFPFFLFFLIFIIFVIFEGFWAGSEMFGVV